MVAYLEQVVNSLKNPPKSPFFKGGGIKFYLILANIFLVILLIAFSNLGILPIKSFGDFVFFTVLFLIFALYRPGWAFLFFIGTVALENINLAPESLGIAVRPYQFFGALSIVAIIIRLLVKRLNFKIPRFAWFDATLLIFAVAGFGSVLGAADKSASFKQSIIAASFVALYFLVRIFIQNIEDLKKIIPFFLSSTVVVIFYGLWQNIRFMQGLSHFEVMAGRPNSVFTEPDWLGIYLVLILSVIYTLICNYYCHSERSEAESKNLLQSKIRSLDKLGMTLLYLFLTSCFVLLIITVSRSAWLGALAVTVVFLLLILTNLKLNPKNWQWKETLRIKLPIIACFIASVLIVYFFNLTNFQLFNRIQSTSTGLQKITISCSGILNIAEKVPEIIEDTSELKKYGCHHINLEEIEKEKLMGNDVYEIYRQDPNVNIRKEIYQKSWAEIKKHPVGGIGWGNISLVLGKDERGMGLNSSDIFLEVWLGTGILGLSAFVILLASSLFRAVKNIIKQKEAEAKIVGIFFILGFVAIIIPNLFNAGIFLGIIWVFFGLANLKFTLLNNF